MTSPHVLLPPPLPLRTNIAPAASSAPAAPAQHRLDSWAAATRNGDHSRSRKLAGLLLPLLRPHGRVCGKDDRHGQ
eukprot:3824216-Prorocentrum_lima.AAC.1